MSDGSAGLAAPGGRRQRRIQVPSGRRVHAGRAPRRVHAGRAPRTVRHQLQRGYLVLTALVLLLLVVPLGFAIKQVEYRGLSARALIEAESMTHQLVRPLREGRPDRIRAVARFEAARVGGPVAIFDGSEQLLAAARAGSADAPGVHSAGHPLVARVLRGETIDALERRIRHDGWISVAAPIWEDEDVVGVALMAIPTETIDRHIWLLWAGLGVFAAGVLVAFAAFGGWLTVWVTRPLRRLGGAAASWSEGDFHDRAALVGGPREVQDLGRAFDDMAGRLDRLLAAHQGFVADASHQLRAPLAVHQMRLENLEPHVTPGGQAKLATLTEEVRDLARCLDDLLVLAAAEVDPPAPCRFDVLHAIHRAEDSWRLLADAHGVELVVSAGTVARQPLAWGAPRTFAQIVENLVTNAIHASPAGGSIAIQVDSVVDTVDVHVIDEGPGLSSELFRRAFERFWRSDDQRPGGTGLGLAIVRRLAESMNAWVELGTAPTGGVDAVIHLRHADAVSTHDAVSPGVDDPGVDDAASEPRVFRA